MQGAIKDAVKGAGTMKANAYAYLRVSGLGQVEGDGFARQEQAIRKYAAANGYQVTKLFREQGVKKRQDRARGPRCAEGHARGSRVERGEDGHHRETGPTGA